MANKDRNKRSARKARAQKRAEREAAQAASAASSNPQKAQDASKQQSNAVAKVPEKQGLGSVSAITLPPCAPR